jgi:antitoxin ParD1/3/4
MPVVTVSLSPELAAKVKAAVASGSYASDSAVIRHALQNWSHDAMIDLTSLKSQRRLNTSNESDVAALFAAFQANKLPRGDV